MAAPPRPRAWAAAVVVLLASPQALGAAAARRELQQSAGLAFENGITATTYEGNNGAIFDDGKLENVCAFAKGSLNLDNGKILLGLSPHDAEFHVRIAGRGSFIAPPQGVLQYGPGCLLYDHVCNYVYQEPCNAHGVCQTNNTCLCGNAYRSCRPHAGTPTAASTGCETEVDNDPSNCGDCGVVCPPATPLCATGLCMVDNSTTSGNSTTGDGTTGDGSTGDGTNDTTTANDTDASLLLGRRRLQAQPRAVLEYDAEYQS